MPYTAEISRANPACFLFLVDQSGSMAGPIGGQARGNKAEHAADAVNRIVDTLVQRCSSGMDVRDYFHVGILGFTSKASFFGDGAPLISSAFRGATPERPFLPISQVAEVAKIVERRVKENDGGRKTVSVRRRMPVWIHPHADRLTPLAGTLKLVEPPLSEWIQRHPNSYPPIVIIVCDGSSSDTNPEPMAQRIRDLRTNDGNVLLFTVHLSNNDRANPTLFPSDERDLRSLGEGQDDSKMMFRMTSVLPWGSIQAAASLGFEVDELSRGLVLNADAVALAQFLDIGTRGPSNLH